MFKVGKCLTRQRRIKWKEHQAKMWETWGLVLTLPPPGYRIFCKSLLFGPQFMYLEIKRDLNKLRKGIFVENVPPLVYLSVVADTQDGLWCPFP